MPSPSTFRDIVLRSEYSDMAMKVEAARLMVYTAAARARRGEPTLSFISSAAKCFASDVAMEVTTNAVQLFGGAGYTVDFPVERMMRDAKITQIYEGTNQIPARRHVGRVGNCHERGKELRPGADQRSSCARLSHRRGPPLPPRAGARSSWPLARTSWPRSPLIMSSWSS
jgi:Acyl-CoA dehydrogenase, C-terminal domain